MEEVKTAETNVVDNYAEVNKEEEIKFTDGETEETKEIPEEKEETKPEEKPKQTPEENAKFARERREAEKTAEIERVRIQSIIEAVEVNPYTDEPIKDAEDVKEYLTMKEIKKNGGDPIADFSKYVKSKQKEEQSKAQEAVSTEEQQKEWYKEDLNDFKTKHPDVNLKNMFGDEEFLKYADGRAGKVKMSKIYEDYNVFKKAVEDKVTIKVKDELAKQVANKMATPGSLQSTEAPDGLYTLEELKKMSQSEIKRNWDKVEKSYAKVMK